jgi:hypothetical protein
MAAAAAFLAPATKQGGSSSAEMVEVEPQVAAAATLQLLCLAGSRCSQAEAAAAVLRCERKLAPQRQGKGKHPVSG